MLDRHGRLVGLDWAKGALVLVMVFYHWMNYFIGLDSSIYKYIRFLTPSFIFVAGFLVAHVYLDRFLAGDGRIPGRLIKRGVKLLMIVLGLNILANIIGTGIAAKRMSGLTLEDRVWAYLTGWAPVAFSVLVPIAYLLIISAGLLMAARYVRCAFHLIAFILVLTAWITEWIGLQNGYLDMLSIGMLGVSLGHTPIASINRLIKPPFGLLIIYVIYLLAITKWNVLYSLQIVGVAVNLLLLYWLGGEVLHDDAWKRTVIRLGEYSLFAYIAQIVLLQMFRKATNVVWPGMGGALFALLAGVVCTILTVEVIHRSRLTIPALDRLYGAVFS